MTDNDRIYHLNYQCQGYSFNLACGIYININMVYYHHQLYNVPAVIKCSFFMPDYASNNLSGMFGTIKSRVLDYLSFYNYTKIK